MQAGVLGGYAGASRQARPAHHAGTLAANKDARSIGPPSALSHTKGVQVTRISSHLPVATVLAVSSLRHLGPSAVAKLAARGTGGMALTALVAVGVLLTAAGSAARGLAAVIAQFLRIAAMMAWVVIGVAVMTLIAVALLMHY